MLRNLSAPLAGAGSLWRSAPADGRKLPSFSDLLPTLCRPLYSLLRKNFLGGYLCAGEQYTPEKWNSPVGVPVPASSRGPASEVIGLSPSTFSRNHIKGGQATFRGGTSCDLELGLLGSHRNCDPHPCFGRRPLRTPGIICVRIRVRKTVQNLPKLAKTCHDVIRENPAISMNCPKIEEVVKLGAYASHAGGQGFKSPHLHQLSSFGLEF